MKKPVALVRRLVPRAQHARNTLSLKHTREIVEGIFGSVLHDARVLSIGNGVAGVLSAAILSLHSIGAAYARLAGITAKSGVKQVDRLIGNDGISLDKMMALWVQFVVGSHPDVVVAMDWTDFEDDDHTTLCIYMATSHNRALPLCWKTLHKSDLKDRRTAAELRLIEQLRDWLPSSTKVTVLADRGFGYRQLYDHIQRLGFDYVIRFRQGILVETQQGERGKAIEFVASNGRPRMLLEARVTAARAKVGAVVTVKKAKMKEAWCLATSLTQAKPANIVALYSRRFSIEETFRDEKDLRFGMGLRATHIKGASRRDRLLMTVAIAHTLLTLLGAASEASGLDKYLKVNTVKRRTHSLYRQGLYWYESIPSMRQE